MSVKIYKPTTPGQRGMTGYTFEEITKTKPEKSLVVSKSKKAGRNMYGRITVRHRGWWQPPEGQDCGFQASEDRYPGQSNCD